MLHFAYRRKIHPRDCIDNKKACALGAITTYCGKRQLVFFKRVACILGAIFTSYDKINTTHKTSIL
jgi:hypothetical protein